MRNLRGRRDGRRRAGHEHVRRPPPRGFQRDRAAVRLHDQWRARVARLRGAGAETGEVGVDRRADIGVDHDRAGPLVFPVFRCDGRRQGNAHLRIQFRDEGADGLLMGRVGIGVQQANRDGFDRFLLDDLADKGPQV